MQKHGTACMEMPYRMTSTVFVCVQCAWEKTKTKERKRNERKACTIIEMKESMRIGRVENENQAQKIGNSAHMLGPL